MISVLKQLGFLGDSDGRESAGNVGDLGSIPGKIPWRRAWQPTPVFLPGESHGHRSMAGYSPWGHKELDTTKQPHFDFLQSLLWWLKMVKSACNAGDPRSIPGSGRSPGEGNGNPLQYSCLENPMDIGAWRATVHGVTKNRTQLSNFHFHVKAN